jgi:glycosyltransferase involved in cell wall biosynthesis
VASGVPVVQPDHGAFPEIVEATKGGILCKPDDLNALVEALDSLLQDDLRRDQITTAGIPAVRELYSATRMAERFEEVLTSVTAKA